MFWHHSREGRTGWRAWWHFRCNVLRLEVNWWGRFCHAYADVDDEGWTFSLAFPPLAIWFSVEGFRLWKPTYETVASWRNNEVITLTDSRECKVAIFDYALWITPWGRSMEWRKSDPWWVRGVTIRPAKLLGPWIGEHEDIAAVPVTIPMPEGTYYGVATVQRWVRGRKYWFKRRTQEVWLEISKGIPHAGKGENSWDCGDDGLFGIGGLSIDDAIERAQASVLKDRSRYGHASPDAIREALKA